MKYKMPRTKEEVAVAKAKLKQHKNKLKHGQPDPDGQLICIPLGKQKLKRIKFNFNSG
tara:strand:+ start:337 stop:510 length:174 start_codon:yes stop_codon:yes gene_type:complete